MTVACSRTALGFHPTTSTWGHAPIVDDSMNHLDSLSSSRENFYLYKMKGVPQDQLLAFYVTIEMFFNPHVKFMEGM